MNLFLKKWIILSYIQFSFHIILFRSERFDEIPEIHSVQNQNKIIVKLETLMFFCSPILNEIIYLIVSINQMIIFIK